MRVGLISFHSFSEPGGVKTHLLALAKEYEKRGINFKIIVPRKKINENYGKKIILLGTSFEINFGGGIADLVFNFLPASIEAVLLKEKFDVLHFHNASFPSFFQILLSPLSFKTTNVLTFHSDIERSQFFKKYPQIFNFFINFCNLRLDGMIAVSPVAFKYLKNFKKLKRIIPNGVDTERFNPANEEIKEFKDEKINLLFVGRIEERKGLIYLLKSFYLLQKKYQNLRLLIIGEGPEKQKCEEFVKKYNLKEVLFLGKVEKNLERYYASADIFCAPSIFGESFGLVLLESMASGLPIVGFSNQGYKSLFKNKRGEEFLVKPRDYKNLAKKIEILIENKNLRKELGEWGRKEAEKYSWSNIAEKILNFYESCQKLRNPKFF